MCCIVLSDDVGQKSSGNKRTEYCDDDEEFTLERTCTKTTEKITANRKSRTSRRETRDDADQRVSEEARAGPDTVRVVPIHFKAGHYSSGPKWQDVWRSADPVQCLNC